MKIYTLQIIICTLYILSFLGKVFGERCIATGSDSFSRTYSATILCEPLIEYFYGDFLSTIQTIVRKFSSLGVKILSLLPEGSNINKVVVRRSHAAKLIYMKVYRKNGKIREIFWTSQRVFQKIPWNHRYQVSFLLRLLHIIHVLFW